jgi:hypothetical protein
MEGGVRSGPDGPRGARGRAPPWLYQDPDDPNHIMLSMEFSSTQDAKAFLEALEPVREVSGVVQSWVVQQTPMP